MLNFNACVCVWGGGVGGYFYVVDFNAIFFEFRDKHQNHFLAKKQNSEEYFHRQHFKREYFHIAY